MFLHSRNNVPRIADELCFIKPTTNAYEIFNYWAGVGEAGEVSESQVFPTKEIKQGDPKTVQVKKYGFVINVSREMVEDNQFTPIVDILGKAMRNSMDQTEEVAGMNLLNFGFNTALQTTPDGVALFSTAHVLKQGGTQSNTATAAALDLDTLWAAINQMKTTKEDSGLIASIYLPKYLVVPQDLERRANELIRSEWVPYTTENQSNEIRNLYPLQVKTSPFLTSTTAWFLLANPNEIPYHGMVKLNRETMNINALFNVKGNTEVGNAVDKDVYAWRVRARYAYAVRHWLGLNGNAGA
jgi:phage major head subunit gpT-like protein